MTPKPPTTPKPYPDSVRIVEVGPRDGLQNEERGLPPEIRIEFIERLADAGLTTIEAGSFVSPEWVPQMANTERVLAGLRRREGVSYPVLVPNMRGLEAALQAGAREIAVFAAASETFSQMNINCTISKSLSRYEEVVSAARAEGMAVRGYVSCTLGCPYEGEVALTAVRNVAGSLFDMGCYEVSLGDTIGVGTPEKARIMVRAISERVPVVYLAVHFHDTYGQALANVLAVLPEGVGVVDSSVAGLGGCPYAPGAAGNLATEDLLFMLDGLGIRTGVHLHKLAAAGRFVTDQLDRTPRSKAAQALAAREE